MALNNSSLDLMLNGLDINRVSLHSGAPGAAGTDNVVGAAIVVTLDTPTDDGTGRKRAVAAAVEFTGLTPGASVTHFGWWKDGTPNVYRGFTTRDTGDATVNAAGEYTVTTATKITLDND